MFTSTVAFASSNPRVEQLIGPTRSCLTFAVYQIEVSDSDQLQVTVTGGTVLPLSEDQTAVCGGVTAAQNSPTSITYTGDDGNCEFTISVTVTWNSSGFRRITARAENGNNSNTRTRTFTGTQVTASGPDQNGVLCSFFGGGSEFFSSQGPPGASISWTASVLGSGPPLNISSPTSASTSISGFVPGNFYSINVTYTCNGQPSNSSSRFFEVVSGTDPRCGFFLTDDDTEKETKGPDIIDLEELDEDADTPDLSTKEGFRTNNQLGGNIGKGITLFPNPAPVGGKVKLKVGEAFSSTSQATTVVVMDLNGRVVTTQEIDRFSGEIPLNNFKTGIYLVRVTNGSETESLSLVVGSRP